MRDEQKKKNSRLMAFGDGFNCKGRRSHKRVREQKKSELKKCIKTAIVK